LLPYWQVYRHDRTTGETVLVSIGVQQASANADCSQPSVSRDGRFVVFGSGATNLTTDDPGVGGGIFLRDLADGTTRRITDTLVTPPQPTPPGIAWIQAGTVTISANGTRVAYSIDRRFWYRGLTGTTGRISLYDVTSGATSGDVAVGLYPQLSTDGRYLGYLDASPGSPPGYTGDWGRGGWLDLQTGATASLTYDPLLAPGQILWSAGARFAAYRKRPAPLILPGDVDPGPFEPFLYDRLYDNAWLLPTGTALGPLDANDGPWSSRRACRRSCPVTPTVSLTSSPSISRRSSMPTRTDSTIAGNRRWA
jgi:hypothetical protein